MSRESNTGLWTRHLSRRSLLQASSLGVAATALGSIHATSVSAGPDEPEQDGGPSPAGYSHEDASHEERVQRAIEQLDAIVSEMMDRSGVPGVAIAVTSSDETLFASGFGIRDSQYSDQVDEDTVFQLASVSKPVASTVISGLVSDGYLEWDSRVSDLLPEFHLYDHWASREVTVRDMLCHRSGLPDHAGDLLEDIGYDRGEVLRRLRYQRPAYSLRDGYRYTNFGLTAGAEAAARAAGATWEAVSKSRLYSPLGMSRTSSLFSEFMAHSNRARGHVNVDGEWRALHVRNPDAQSPAGGVSSTVNDLARWMRLHLGGGTVEGEEIIRHEPLAEAYRPHSVSQPAGDPLTDRTGFYGLGWNVSYDNSGNVRLGHSGAFELGAATAVSIVPAWDVGICVLTNAAPIGLPEAIVASFIDLIESGEIQLDYLEIIGDVFAEALAPPYRTEFDIDEGDVSPPLDSAAYLGSYGNDLYGDIEVAEVDSELRIRIGPGPSEYEVSHVDRDTFIYVPDGENAYGPSAITFSVDPDGIAQQVAVDILNNDGQGVFVRSQD